MDTGGCGGAESAPALPRLQRQDPAREEQLPSRRGRRPSGALHAQRQDHAQVRLGVLPRKRQQWRQRRRHAPLSVKLLHVVRCEDEKYIL